MNERIKEFEKQCWNHQSNCLNTEKFADLIVRECVSQIESYETPLLGNTRARELACEWTYDALRTVSGRIKETFGVLQYET